MRRGARPAAWPASGSIRSFTDAAGAAGEALYARRLGYRSKSLVRADHAAAINAVFTPSPEEIGRARRIVAAFDAARACGEDRALVDGLWIEVPTALTARRLLDRAARFEGNAPGR